MDFSNVLHKFATLINFTKFLNRFVKVATRICQSCFLDLSTKSSCISHHLPNKPKLKFNQDFIACWSFCFELKLLKNSMPCVHCAFGNISFIIIIIRYAKEGRGQISQGVWLGGHLIKRYIQLFPKWHFPSHYVLAYFPDKMFAWAKCCPTFHFPHVR